MKVQAITTKPLDGQPEGTPREFEQADFDNLARMHAVRRVVEVSDEEPVAPRRRPRT